MTAMRRRIPSPPGTPSGKKKRSPTAAPQGEPAWKNQILLYLEGEDPRLLDKETYKVYCHISGTGTMIQGPIPLPVQEPEGPRQEANSSLVHRRLFKIHSPSPKVISLLEKLPLSGSVEASVTVEDTEADD